MSKFINTILVCTTIMCCSNVNSSDYKTEVWNYLNCNVRDVTNLSIDTSSGINSNDYGRLFYYKDNVKVYPVDNDGKYFYDLQSRIDTVKTNSKSLFKSDSEWSGGNLVVIPTGVKSKITNMGKTLTIGTCSLTNPNGFAPGANVTVNIPSETNLIVPQYILLNTNKIQLKFDQGSYNNKLLILGKITTDNNTADECISIVGNNGSGNNRTVIFGPRSFVRNGKSLHKSIIKSTNDKYINYILYPGCVLGDDAQYNKHGNKKLCNKNNCLFKESGNIYMNRFGFLDTLNYREHCNRLFGLIGKSFNLFFPGNTKMIEQEICISTEDDNNPGTYKLNHLSPFIKLYWAGSFNSHINGTNSIGKYISKYPEKTLDFVEDKTGKKVLNINPNNPLARCDIAYCDKFSVHDYNYGLNRLYNTKDNIDKYINVDTIDDLFYNGKDCCNEFCKGADLNASELINILVDGLSDFYTTDNFYNTEKIIRLTMKMYSFFSQFTDKVIIKLLNNRDDFNSFFPGFFGEITKNLLLLIRIVEKSEDGELLSLLSEFVEKQPEITADLEDTFQIIIKITLPYLIQAKNLLLRLVPFIDNISSNNFISNINLDEIAKLFNRVRDVLGTFLDGIKTSQQDPETEDIIVLTLKEAVDKHISENENNSEPDILNILDQKEFSIGSTVVLKKSKKDFNPKLVFSIFGYNLPIAHIPLELITKLNFKQTVDISSLVYGPQTFKYFTDNIPKDDTTAEYATFKKQTQQQISNMINGLLSAVNVDALLKHLFHAFNGLLSVDIKYSKIYPRLISNKPIVINSSGTDILLYVDNSEFNSKIFFSNLNYKKTLSLYNPNSMVNIENANILNLCSNNYIMWDLAKFSNEVKFDITNQDSRNCSICFIDNSIKKKYNIMKFTGNNSNYKANEDINNSGIVYIPSTITDLVFANPNNKVLISTNKYIYTGIDENNALELIKDTSGSGIQNIHIGKDAIPLNKNSKEWNS